MPPAGQWEVWRCSRIAALLGWWRVPIVAATPGVCRAIRAGEWPVTGTQKGATASPADFNLNRVAFQLDAHPEFFESIKRAGATPAMRGFRRFRRCPLGAFAENARRQMLNATPVVEAVGAGDSGFAAPCGTRRHHVKSSSMPRKPAWNKAAALAAPCGTSLNRGQLRFALAGPAFRWRGLQALRTSGSTSAPRRRRSR